MFITKQSGKEDGKTFDITASLEAAPIPEVPSKKKCTNNLCLTTFILCLLFLVPLTIIFSKGTDINRFIYGYDRWGNTCGSKNTPIKGVNCSGKDMTKRPIALVRYQKTNELCPFSKVNIVPDRCVSECYPPDQLLFHRCYPPNVFRLTDDSKNMKLITEMLHIIDQNLPIIILLSFSGIVVTLVLFMCLRCHVAVTFWILTTFQLVVFMAATAYIWHKYMTSEDSSLIYLLTALAATGYLVFLFCFLIFFHGTFPLIFGLYEEAVNAIWKIPLILIQPLLTLMVLLVTITSMVFLIFLVSSKKYLEPTAENPTITFEYFSNLPAAGYICYVFLMMLWIYSFSDGCQSMVIAGAVTNYYFTRDKANLSSPFSKSIAKMLRHLGTVSLGSLIVTVMTFMRSVAEYIINKTYIQTAMHETSFWISTCRATKLVCANLINAIAITGFNYIIINGFSFLAMLLTMLVGIWMNLECNYTYYTWMGLVFGSFGACLVTLFMMSAINTSLETVFFCFCEDQISNNGNDRPYYMSQHLQHLMEKSKEYKMRSLNQA